MGDDRLTRLRLCADFKARRQGRLQVLNALEALGQGGEPVDGDVGLGASRCSPCPFVERLGHRASGQTRRLASMDHRISSGSCSNMPSPFMRLEVTSASWQSGSRWLQRTSPGGGSWVCLRDPSCPREISASASSTSTLPWGRSPRARRRFPLLVASSLGRTEKRLGAGGLCLPTLS
jgi:hypothetical protein